MRVIPFLFGIVFLLVGCFGAIGTWVVHGKHSRAYVNGVRVNAEIVRKYVLRAVDGSSEYMIDYRFGLPSEAVQEGATEVSKEKWQVLKTGDVLLLAYLPDEPWRVILPELGAPSILLPIFVSAVSLAIAVFGIVALVSSARSPAVTNAA